MEFSWKPSQQESNEERNKKNRLGKPHNRNSWETHNKNIQVGNLTARIRWKTPQQYSMGNRHKRNPLESA
eukprot:8394186-Pyramimonas_sp.AAC.1